MDCRATRRKWPTAVRLFCDRAVSARDGFVLGADNVDAVAQICGRLDGIPLAIELAAARVRMMTPGEIAGRLDERFRLLTGGARTAVERHQTLRQAVDWSYDLLAPRERELLNRLGVFAGGFTLDAAVSVAAGDGNRDLRRARRPRPTRRQVTRRRRPDPGRDPVPAARDDPPVLARTSRRCRRNRHDTPTPRHLVRRVRRARRASACKAATRRHGWTDSAVRSTTSVPR